ncbi:protein kinase [Fragilaria crotonensis]|nr:protein kinase [Fragilaria crotonensis]
MTTKGPSKEALRKAGSDYAQKKTVKMFAKSMCKDLSDDFPKFKLEELQIGKFLGKGGFGTVKEVRAFHIGTPKMRKKGAGPDPVADDDLESRMFIAEHCIRSGGKARYAVKFLSPEVVNDPAMYIMGITDMAVETRFLSSTEHPNIIKMRAIAEGNHFCETYFISHDWNDGQTRGLKGTKAKELLEERLVIAFDLCSAFKYLHDRHILYRDIKPENIGFDVRGDVKLFDFGLAKEICSDTPRMSNGTYKLTGQTGSPRYMAPEVANELPYNEKCDVYSMSILFWQMMTCKVPFENNSATYMKEKVYNGDKRPIIERSWSASTKLLLRRGWTSDLSNRFSMQNLEEILKREITALRGGDATGLEHLRRRSTHVYHRHH